MAPRKTCNTIEAEELLAEVRSSTGKSTIYKMCGAPHSVRQAMYRRMTDEEKKHTVIQMNGDQLIVSQRPEPKAARLMTLLKETLHHIDDDILYDRIMEVLYGTQVA